MSLFSFVSEIVCAPPAGGDEQSQGGARTREQIDNTRGG